MSPALLTESHAKTRNLHCFSYFVPTKRSLLTYVSLLSCKERVHPFPPQPPFQVSGSSPQYTDLALNIVHVTESTSMTERGAMKYKHNSLQDCSSMRLLNLLPGSYGATLKCQIIEIQDPSSTSYEALSYTWGDSVSLETIEVCVSLDSGNDDRSMIITRNLYDALQRLRTDEPRRLWVDAICINQDDLQEKAHQVARMGQIYGNADNVIVWLGEDDAYPRTRALLKQDGKNRWPLTLPEVDLGELVTIPWFFRVWAVQEYVLPQHAVYQLGALTIPAPHVETVITRTGAYLEREKKLYDQWKSICLLFEYRKLVQERRSNQDDQRLTLVRTFLDLTRQRLCKDSRDRIYGILGIFESADITPDYSLPQQQVYQNFVSKHLEAGDYAILHECCIGIPNADEQSYVPFFGQSQARTKYIPFADPLRVTYSAGLHHSPQVTVDEDASISIRGFSIGKIAKNLNFSEDCKIELDSTGLVVHNPSLDCETGQLPLHSTWGAIYQMIIGYLITESAEQLRWREDYKENRLSLKLGKAPYPHNSLFEVLIRTIRTELGTDLDWVSSTGQIRSDAHLHSLRREMLAERSLFWTEQGYIGLGSRHLQAGDEVVVFDGDTTSFLLRKEDNTRVTDNFYKIVSDCYVYGWMHGPFPDRTVKKDPSRRRSVLGKLRGDGKQGGAPTTVSRTFFIS
jgi:hypothetical protein